MQYYSLGIEVDRGPSTADEDDAYLEHLLAADMNPSISTSPRGFLRFRLTLQSTGVVPAIIAATSTVEKLTGAAPLVVEALPEAEAEAREGYAEVPDLVSITQAAEMLGRTRQRVFQMIDLHLLPSARQVGTGWVIARSDVEAKLATNYDATLGEKYDGTLPDGTPQEAVAKARGRARRGPIPVTGYVNTGRTSADEEAH